MVLSDQAIKKLVNERQIIEPFSEDRLQAVSYDISSSNIIRVYQRLNKSIDIKNQSQLELETVEMDITEGYNIKPGEYILVKTKENISMPDDLTGHIRPRTTFTRVGLLLSDQHINPSFCGHLYLGLYNSTPNNIYIYPDLNIGQIVFEKIEGLISAIRLYSNKKDAKYQHEDSFIIPKIDVVSDERISNLIHKVLED